MRKYGNMLKSVNDYERALERLKGIKEGKSFETKDLSLDPKKTKAFVRFTSD